jgi:two-component system, cell cycle sensor histidine kinase and response regulator CckA
MTSFLRAWLAHLLASPPAVPAAGEMGILVVDDQASACLFADRVLRLSGYRAVVASSGREAVRKAKAMPRVDVLVTDLIMPGMDGAELALTLRRRDEDMKVLYMTGLSQRLFGQRVALREGDALLEKPYTVAALEHAFSMLTYGEFGRPKPIPNHAAAPALWI